METSAVQEPLRPRPGKQRLVVLDVLRGFALFGILLVNVLGFSGVRAMGAEAEGIDRLVFEFIRFFAQAKFLSLFAVLFGIGFTMQLASLQRQGAGLFPLYWRRLAALFVIGLLHTRLEPAEVLAVYALCGAVLVLFRDVTWKVVLLVGVVLTGLPYLHTAVVTPAYVADPAAQMAPEVPAETAAEPDAEDEMHAWNPYLGGLAIKVHSGGSFADVVAYNHEFTARRWTTSWVSYLWMTIPLPLMMFGMLIGRSEILTRIAEERRRLKRVFGFGLAGGVGLGALVFFLYDLAGKDGWNPWVAFPADWGFGLSGLVMAMAYAAGLLLLLQRPVGAILEATLAPVGRMALTNYLLQTVICTSLFFGYGFGLYGRVGAATVGLIAVAIFAIQVVFSRLWMRTFQYGPVEWLWRTVTYWRRLALAPGQGDRRPAQERPD
jgi:uncharacterized protein